MRDFIVLIVAMMIILIIVVLTDKEPDINPHTGEAGYTQTER